MASGSTESQPQGANLGWFHHYIESHRAENHLIVQPRMGLSNLTEMRHGLEAVRQLPFARIGTITLDSLTRQCLWLQAEAALLNGAPLNGFPIVAHGPEVTRAMLQGVLSADFPVQVRHGSPLPERIFEAAHTAGIDSIEGGPVSYCLPYGRVPLADSVEAWDRAVRFWAEAGRSSGTIHHLETFGGCMMGQLAPPDLLVALSVLEALFFAERGIRSLSLSISQGTNFSQDVGAVLALRRLAEDCLPAAVRSHIVFYTWMGVFPETGGGARRLIEDSAIIAAVARAERMIVKTAVEGSHLPAVADNIHALTWADAAARQGRDFTPAAESLEHAEEIRHRAKRIVEAVLNLSPRLDQSLLVAFDRGILDVPFCLHPDNRNEARAHVDPRTGVVRWDRTGKIPVLKERTHPPPLRTTSRQLLASLAFNQRKYDEGSR
jgi:methylaspartate mutase epsilon subunit